MKYHLLSLLAILVLAVPADAEPNEKPAPDARPAVEVDPAMQEVLDKIKEKNEDVRAGIDIVRRAIEEPLRQIANNAGKEGSVVVNEVRNAKEANWGYDARNEKFCDMVKAGIIDPTKVVRTALQNAASVAGLMLTTEALISEIPEEKKEAAPGMGGGMDF